MVGQLAPPRFDRQAFFTKTLEHLLTQGRPASPSNSQFCVYRSPEGLKCAFGVHIEDAEYVPEMEGNSVWTLNTRYPTIFDRLRINTSVDLEFVQSLQTMHDESSDLARDRWRIQVEGVARRIARKHQLTLPETFVWSEV